MYKKIKKSNNHTYKTYSLGFLIDTSDCDLLEGMERLNKAVTERETKYRIKLDPRLDLIYKKALKDSMVDICQEPSDAIK